LPNPGISNRGRTRAKYRAMAIASDSRVPSMDSNLPRKSALRGPKIARCKSCRASVCPENKAVEGNQGRVLQGAEEVSETPLHVHERRPNPGKSARVWRMGLRTESRGLVDGRRGDKCTVPGAGEILRPRDPRDRRDGRSEMRRKSKRSLLKCAIVDSW
jgi:hypothetical protein